MNPWQRWSKEQTKAHVFSHVHFPKQLTLGSTSTLQKYLQLSLLTHVLKMSTIDDGGMIDQVTNMLTWGARTYITASGMFYQLLLLLCLSTFL